MAPFSSTATDLLSASPEIEPTGFTDLERALLTEDATAFLVGLERQFRAPIAEALARRVARRARIARGEEQLDFLWETAGVRERDWTVAPQPQDLLRRAVEIT